MNDAYGKEMNSENESLSYSILEGNIFCTSFVVAEKIGAAARK